MSAEDISKVGGEVETEKVASKCCASCGKAEIDDIKLKDCDKCDLARYCGDQCQKEHLETHEAICKERAAELRDEILFRQPESSHHGDCPICFLPMPFDRSKSVIHSCCCKVICSGCVRADGIRALEQGLKLKCSFCRQPMEKNEKEAKTRLMNRAKRNDPDALMQIGVKHLQKGDYNKAFKYLKRAAELGDADAHYNLSLMYRKGEGVEKDEERDLYHAEEAAIAGHPEARYNLGLHEMRNHRFDRAVRHWIIGANLGYDDSIQILKMYYKEGHVSKDDLAAALRAHQAATDATKSPQREESNARRRFRQFDEQC